MKDKGVTLLCVRQGQGKRWTHPAEGTTKGPIQLLGEGGKNQCED